MIPLFLIGFIRKNYQNHKAQNQIFNIVTALKAWKSRLNQLYQFFKIAGNRFWQVEKLFDCANIFHT